MTHNENPVQITLTCAVWWAGEIAALNAALNAHSDPELWVGTALKGVHSVLSEISQSELISGDQADDQLKTLRAIALTLQDIIQQGEQAQAEVKRLEAEICALNSTPAATVPAIASDNPSPDLRSSHDASG